MTAALSPRAELSLELLGAVWQGRSPEWIEHLVDVPARVPAELWLRRDPAARPHPLALHPLPLGAVSALPDAVAGGAEVKRQWWSGGERIYRGGAAVTGFFHALFGSVKRAARSLPHCAVELSLHDLFHGHLFAVPRRLAVRHGCRGATIVDGSSPAGQSTGCGHGELGLIMHAKELPTDIFPAGDDDVPGNPADTRSAAAATFDTAHPAYRARNLLWLASLNAVFVVRIPLWGRWEELLQLGPEWAQMGPSLRRVLREDHGGVAPHRLAYRPVLYRPASQPVLRLWTD
jgi:hypothetical protein